MGHRLFLAAAGDVCGGAVDGIRPQRLVLARDRMGIKPLYMARRGEDLYFGSELKTIFAHPEIGRTLSLAGLDCYLALNYVPRPGRWWTESRSCRRGTGWNGGGQDPHRMLLAIARRPNAASIGTRGRAKQSSIGC